MDSRTSEVERPLPSVANPTDSRVQGPPFSIRVLQIADKEDAPQPSSLLPASYPVDLKGWTEIEAPSSKNATSVLEQELDIQRLTAVIRWLWVAGRPMPPRALQNQRTMGRDIFITESMDTHLLWAGGRIFIKPMPRFLLEPGFWNKYLTCAENCKCLHVGAEKCKQRQLWACALGFLLSYAALIRHEGDFALAKDTSLLPSEIKWSDWRTFVRQVLETKDLYQMVNERFVYGELRLGRLNKIYLLRRGPFYRGYVPYWRTYGSLMRDQAALIASAITYVAIILTAMQVGLATSLAGNSAFQSVSYGFTIFSMIGPHVAAGFAILYLVVVFVGNLVLTVRYKDKRFRSLKKEV